MGLVWPMQTAPVGGTDARRFGGAYTDDQSPFINVERTRHARRSSGRSDPYIYEIISVLWLREGSVKKDTLARFASYSWSLAMFGVQLVRMQARNRAFPHHKTIILVVPAGSGNQRTTLVTQVIDLMAQK